MYFDDESDKSDDVKDMKVEESPVSKDININVNVSFDGDNELFQKDENNHQLQQKVIIEDDNLFPVENASKENSYHQITNKENDELTTQNQQHICNDLEEIPSTNPKKKMYVSDEEADTDKNETVLQSKDTICENK